MRKVIFLLLTATVLWSCQNATFTIKGTVIDPNFEGANVYLQERTDDGLQTLETAVVQNGTFSFTGIADENAARYVSLSETPEQGVQDHVRVLLVQGTTEITFGDVITVSGAEINTLLHEFRVEEERLRERVSVVFQQMLRMHEAELTDEARAELLAEGRELAPKRRRLITTFVRDNIENAAGRHVFAIFINEHFEPEEQKELIARLDDNFRAYPSIARVIARLENMERIAVGQRFTDFTLPNPEGNEVSLSDFAGQGNYTLIVFWATWCAPCIQSVPQLREIYARYQSREFQMVGVSFDRDHDALVNGIRNLNITWPQMVDLNRENSVWDLYAISGIPHTVLLNREGYIIANSLRGEALNSKLAELMP